MKILRNLKKLTKSALLLATLAVSAGALPEGANVTNGTVNINTSGSTQTITQSSNKAIINWNGFNIDVGELVHFVQPSSISAILNRVVGEDPSQILGALRSNGQVFLVNPNGVVFGHSAQIDVGSLVVSTLNIQDDDFLAGNLNFSQEADKDLAAVINHGTIKIDDNGFLVLTGPMVANDGVILAKVGQVALAAGTQSTVSFDPTGMIQVALPTGAEAQEGIVSLSQQAAGDILSGVIGTSITQAGQIVERDGQIFLDVQSGTVVQAGDISTDGQAGEGAGNIILDSTTNTILSADSVTSAAGQGFDSDGGNILVLSDGASESQVGSFADVSGGLSGDAGFVEQSSVSGLTGLTTDLSAADGEAGTFLIDPLRLFVDGGAPSGPGVYDMTVLEATLEGQAAGTVLLQATNGIGVGVLTGGSLTLQSGVNLVFDITGALGDGVAAIDFESAGTFAQTQGAGSITVTSNSPEGFNNLDLRSVDGNITLTAASGGDFTGTTNFATTGTGDIAIDAAASNFTGTTNLTPGDRFSLNTNDVTNLQLNVASQLTGTSSADLTVNASGRDIQLNGVDTTGGLLTLISNNVTQTNPGNVNEGDFSFSAFGDIGALGQPLRVDGSIQAMLTGDLFVESVNDLELNNIDATNITGTGDNFDFSGNVGDSFLTSTVTLTGGVISGNGDITGATVTLTGSEISGTGRIIGDTITLDAATIGAARGSLEVDADTTLTVTADNLFFDSRDGPNQLNITRALDPSLIDEMSFFEIESNGGEGSPIFFDDGSDISASGFAAVTANLVGDRDFSNLGGFQDISITTVADLGGDGDLTGSVDLGFGAVSLTAENVTITDIQVDGIMNGPVSATATAGSVDIDQLGVPQSPFGIDITANALVDVNIDIEGALTSTGGLTAPTVVLSATDILVTTTTSDLDATSTSGDIDITNTLATPLAFTADGGSGIVTLVSGGDINTGDVIANRIILTANGTGSITSVGLPAVSALSTTDFIDLAAGGGVDVNTETTSGGGVELTIDSNGTIDVFNTASGRVDVDIDSNGNAITFDNRGGRVQRDINGSSVVILNDADINVDSTASVVDATTTAGDVTLFLTAPSATVTGSTTDPSGDFAVLSDGDMIVGATGISATNLVVFNSLGDITSLGTITTPDLFVERADSIQVDLVGTFIMDVIADGDITLTNTGASATDALLASLVGGNISMDNGAGDLTIVKAFANNGNINLSTTGSLTATFDPSMVNIGESFTPPGNTIAAFDSAAMDDSGGQVTLNGSSITANLTAERVIASSTGGNIILNGTESPDLEVTATSTPGTGDITVTNVGNIAANQITGAGISLDANSFGIAQNSGSLTGTTVDLMADTITSITQTTDLTATALAGDVDITNTGNLTNATLSSMGAVSLDNTGSVAGLNISGDVTDVMATGDISGSAAGTTSVALTGDNITVTTQTPDVTATSTTGNIDISDSSMAPLTANINTTGTVDLTTQDDDANLNTVSGSQVNVDVGNGALTGTVNATTGLNIDARTANLTGSAPSVTGGTSDGSFTFDGTSGDTNFSAVVVGGGSVITHVGDVTGTLTGGSVDVTAANINAATTSSTIVAEATAPSGTITLTGVRTVTATAPGDVDLSGTGDITLNNISGDNVTVLTAGGSVTSNGGTNIVGDLVNLEGMGVNVTTQANRLFTRSRGAMEDLILTNSGTNLTSTTLLSDRDIVFVSDGDVAGLNATAVSEVNLTATDSVLGGGAVVSITEQDITLTAGSIDVDINAIGNPPFIDEQTVVFTSTLGNAQIAGVMLDNLNISGTAAGDAILSNSGNLNVGAVSAANINVSSTTGDIVQTAGRLTTPGTVTLSAESINASTDASALDATSTVGNLILDNDSPTLTSVILDSAQDITFTTSGDAAFTSTSGQVVSLTAGLINGAITGNVGASTSLNLMGTSIDVDLANGVPVVVANTTAGPIDILANSADLEVTAIASTSMANSVVVNNTGGNIAANRFQGETTSITASGDITSISNVINGPTSVTLDATNINVDVETTSVIATGTGNIDITNVIQVPLTANITTTGTVDLVNQSSINLNTVSGSQVNVTANNSGALTGTVTGTTGLDIQAGSADLDVDSPMVTGTLGAGGNLDITGSTLAGMDIDVTVPGTSLITNTGDITGTLDGTTVDVTAANINAATTAPVIMATATAVGGTIDLVGNSTPLTATATADGNINISNVGGRFGTGDIVANDITSTSGNITLDATAGPSDGSVTSNPSSSLTGDLITVSGSGVDIETQAQRLDVTSTGFLNDLIVNNTGTNITSTTLRSDAEITVTTDGDLMGLNVSALEGVTLTATDSVLGSGTVESRGGDPISLTAGSIDVIVAFDEFNFDQTVVFDSTMGDAMIAGFLFRNFDISGTATGDAILSNSGGDINVGAVDAANITVTTTGGDINQTAGRLTTPGTVTLSAETINASTDASALDVTSTMGNLTLDNDSPTLTSVLLDSAQDITFTTTGDVNFTSTAGQIVDLDATGMITGTVGASASVELMGSTIDVDLANGTPEVVAIATSGDIDILANSTDLEISAEAPFANSIIVNNTGGNIATNRVQADIVSITANGDITRAGAVDAINGRSSVTLNGAAITAVTVTTDLTALGTGDIDLLNVLATPLTANIMTVGDIDLTGQGDISLNTVSGRQVDVRANNDGLLTGTVAGTTGLDLFAGGATLNVDSPMVTGTVTGGGNLDITGSTLAGMDIDVIVPGTSMLTNTGDITGTLDGTTVTVMAANINAATTAPVITATATTPLTGFITLTGVDTVTATAPGDVDLSGTGDITLNNILGDNVTVLSTGGSIIGNGGTNIVGDLVTLEGNGVNVTTQANQLNATNSFASEDLIITNSGSSLSSTILSSARDIMLVSDGDVLGVDATGAGVIELTATASLLSGTASSTSSGPITLSAGSISAFTATGPPNQTVSFTATAGDANIDGTSVSSLSVSGTATGDANLSNQDGDLSVGAVSAANIDLQATNGSIIQTAGRIVTPGTVTLRALDIDADTDASAIDATSTFGNLILDNDSPTLTSVVLDSAQDITFTTSGDAAFTSTSGQVVSLTGGVLTGAVAGTTSIDVTAEEATLDINTPIFTADLSSGSGTNLSITSTAGGATDFDVIVPTGDTTVVHNGNVTGTLRGGVVDVTGATIDVDTFTAEVIAEATAANGTIDIIGNFSPFTATATADGNITITNNGGRFGTGDIAANDITSANGNITLDGTSGSVTTNVGRTLSGDLVTVDGTVVDIDTQATGLNVTSTSGDVTVDNTVTAMDPVIINSSGDVFFTTSGAATNLDVMASGVIELTATASLLSGTASSTSSGPITLSAGSISAFTATGPPNQTVSFTATAGDANIDGTAVGSLSVSGTATGNANLSNQDGDLSLGTVNAANIDLRSPNGRIIQGSGRIITPGTVTLRAVEIDAETNAGAIDATSTFGNLILDNDSPTLTSVVLDSAQDITFTTTGDAAFTSTSGATVSLQADGALTGTAGATNGLTLDGNSVMMNVVTPVLDVTSNTGFTVQGNSADMQATGTAFSGNVEFSNTGNIATNAMTGNNITVTSSAGNITRNSGALTANPGGAVTLSANNITAETNSDIVVANASAGNVNIDSNLPLALNLSGSATGTFTANQNGDLTTGNITASTIDLTTTDQGSGNDIIAEFNTFLTADQVNLDGGSVTAVTTTAGLDIRSDSSIAVSSFGRSITSGTLVAGTDVGLLVNNNDVSGLTATGQNVNLVNLGSGDFDVTANATTAVSAIGGDNVTLNMTGTELQVSADGDLNVTANSANVDLQTIMLGDINITNTGGGLSINEVSGQNVTLDTQNTGSIIKSATGPGTLTATTSATLRATDITADIITPVVTAITNGGSIALNGTNPTLTVTADAMGGDVTVNNTGNIATNNISGGTVTLDTRNAVGPQGNITRNSGSITATNLNLEGTNVTATTSVSTITANAPGDINITNTGTNITQADLIAGGTVGLITDGTANLNNFQGTSLTLSVAQAVTGSLVGNTINVTGTDINVSVGPVTGTTANVTANATTGDVVLNGTTTDLTVAASADNGTGPGSGDVSITNTGNIATNAINGSVVSIAADGGAGDITNSSGRIVGNNSVTLTGNDVTASTTTTNLTAQNANTLTIDDNSSSVQASLSASGAVDLTSAGAVTSGSSLSGSSVRVGAQSIDSAINTANIQTTTTGDTTLASNSNADLMVESSSSTNGDYTLTHQGNVDFDLIQAQNVTIDAGPTGNITDVSGNTIIATGITLTGNTILVSTQGQIITINAQGDVTISNTVVDVSSLDIDATNGNVTFGTEGDLTITQVAGGPLVSLQAENNINANTGAVVSGTDVKLEVGGQITPDLDNPLDVQATNSIEVIAPFGGPVLSQGSNIAAALEGIIPAGAVIFSPDSGPIFYNGVLLNPTSGGTSPPVVNPPTVIPPVVPPTQVIDQLGQQNGQVFDDGSVGSAANDGLVETSPTQELVAQLTEGVGGGGGGGLSTERLVTLEVNELGELQVSLGAPSPFDTPVDSSETMTADDILDLDTGELTDVKVAVYYDATNDQLVMAIDLRADDVIDLDVGDYQEIPINLEYSFLSDPKLILEKLRADDLIDLMVEDLGLIPIKINVYEDDDEDEDEVEEEILKQKKKTKQGETE